MAFRIRLSPAEWQVCEDYSNKIKKKVEHNPNYTGLMESNRFFVGRAGELALGHCLRDSGVLFEETVRHDGIPDDQDFIVMNQHGQPRTINVKNTLHPRGANLMQPVSQMEKGYRCDYYFGASGTDLGPDTGIEMCIHGYIAKHEFHDRALVKQVKVQTLCYPLARLYPLESLLSMLKKS